MNEHLSGHLSGATLSALVDGELAAAQMSGVNEHLAGCAACTSSALAQALVKNAVAKAGQRYAPPADLGARLARLAKEESAQTAAAGAARAASPSRVGWLGLPGWGVAFAALLLFAAGAGLWEQRAMRTSQTAALVAEMCDQHVATLAANAPLEVVSSDRHTVKPWFQGRLPFSFNLPEELPADTTLDGANLAYLHGRPEAQLVYSVGRHRVSVFVGQREEAAPREGTRAGFHVESFVTGQLEAVAVSDVEPRRLAELMNRIRAVQEGEGGVR